MPLCCTELFLERSQASLKSRLISTTISGKPKLYHMIQLKRVIPFTQQQKFKFSYAASVFGDSLKTGVPVTLGCFLLQPFDHIYPTRHQLKLKLQSWPLFSRSQVEVESRGRWVPCLLPQPYPATWFWSRHRKSTYNQSDGCISNSTNSLWLVWKGE